MAKFKVGDRVQVVDDRGGRKLGETGEIIGIDITLSTAFYYIKWDAGVHEQGLYENRLEALPVAEATGKPAFKVGDRVRLIKDGLSTTGAVGKLATIEAWSDGKVVDNGQYLLNIDGPVDYETLAVRPQYTRASPKCFELLAPSLTIETGKFYRTRDGRKVGPMDEWISDQFRERAGDGRYWTVDGVGHNEAKGEDLIAEWIDEPASNDNQPIAKQPAGTADLTFNIGSDTTELEGGLDRVIAKLERIKALKAEIAA